MVEKFHTSLKKAEHRVQVVYWCTVTRVCFFFNWDSLHARLNSNCKAWSYKKKKQKILKHTGNLFRKNLQLKMSVNSRLKTT